MFELNIKKQTITLAGVTYHQEQLNDIRGIMPPDLYDFLCEWFSKSKTISVQTSGSTGTPKIMFVEKEKMMQSARLTCTFLNLKKGDKTLLCMALKYIGAKMMVVRSLIARLDLYTISPSGNPLKNNNIQYDFAAMVPLQVYNSLQQEAEKKHLKEIKNLIIGGGAIDQELAREIQQFPNHVYSTYGMTETLSHIALRKLNGKDASDRYYPFESVSLKINKQTNTLIIDAPLVCSDQLQTNDIAQLFEDGSFKIVGRADNIINSGGIKIQIEEVENLINPIISGYYAISSFNDTKFGEIVVLVLSKESVIDMTKINHILPSYSTPKKILHIDAIPMNDNGKINRSQLKEIVHKALSEG